MTCAATHDSSDGRRAPVAASPRWSSVRSLAGCGATVGGSTPRPDTGGSAVAIAPGPWDWPTYGHDAQHTFHGRTTLTPADGQDVAQGVDLPHRRRGDGHPDGGGRHRVRRSWDDDFYAVNLETGKLRWKYTVKAQHGVTPYPGEKPRDLTSDGGLITSSAWFQPARRRAGPASSSSAAATPSTP